MPVDVDAVTDLAAEFPQPTLDQWRQLVDKALKGGDFDRRLVARTADGLRIEPLFTTRPKEAVSGTFSAAGRSEGWDIRQLHAGSDPVAANAAILEDLAGGATSITLQMASPGRHGLPCTAAGMAQMLKGVLLDVCPIALHAGEATPAAAADVVTVWDAQGLSAVQRRGAFNYDPLGALAETGGLIQTLPAALDEAAALVRRCQAWPQVTALRADGHLWHAAGASEAQELAGVLSAVVAYLRAAEAAGISPTDALPKIVVNLAVDADQMLGLAKLRASRRLIASVASACGAPGAASHVVLTAETSRAMMTRRDPWVNMLRTSMACATAAWAGADCITVLPYTWSLGQPDAFARRMARNTSIVLMEESGLGRVADPAAGSFAIETLTSDLEKAAWGVFQQIEAEGGLAAVLQSGRFQADVAATAAAKAAAIATGKLQITGTSAFPRLGDDGVEVQAWPALVAVSAPRAIEVVPLAAFRPAEPFERLRDAADAFAARTGQPLKVFLACLGPLASHAARATWIGNFLAAGGIASEQSAPLLQSSEAGQAFATSGATIACVCGADETYALLGEATVSLLKSAGATHVLLAGRPKAEDVALKAAGVDTFIFAGCDMIETLTDVQTALGVAGNAA